ncbi:MAG TPA: alpha/beta hydrolase [Candidatus Polarisedimenticolaceae bacterium]|nr:alpha/beta hydrolase [Candidatus Polarisedimenticolaceae bacterium]
MRPEHAARVAILSAVSLSAACGGPGAPDAPAGPDPRLAAGRHEFVTEDGAAMPYVVEGDGETALVLIHGWMCDRTFWDAQLPVLRERYLVITLDLPGHGEGGETRERWSVAGFGEDVAALVERLDLERVVLVGHSMGGEVALRAAALARGRVIGIVGVDTLHDAEFDFARPDVAQMIAAVQQDFRGTCAAMVESMFVEESAESVEANVRRRACEESNAAVGTALILDFVTIDLPAWFREAGVPIRAINAAAPNPTRVDTNRKYADFDAVLIDGVGHFPHMTRPDEFNARLLQALDGLTTGR